MSEEDYAALGAEPGTVPTGASAEPTYLEELEKLAALRDQGTITGEEFQAKKGQLLGL
jgi:hypothetical protein